MPIPNQSGHSFLYKGVYVYIFLDTETGGIDPYECSLLSFSYILADVDLNVLATADYFVSSDRYCVSSEALKVNGIDLVWLKEHGKTLQEVDGGCVVRLLGYKRLIPVGWNVQFDVGFIKTYLPRFASLLGYHMLDVQSIAKYLHMKSRIPVSRGLHTTAEAVGLTCDSAHTAKDDTKLTYDLFRLFMKETDNDTQRT